MSEAFELTKTCRTAGLHDTDRLVKIIREFMVNTPYTEYNFSNDRVAEVLKLMMLDMHNNIVLASMDGDEIVGVLCGKKILPPFSLDPVAVEICWALTPEYKTGRRGYELLQAYEIWARKVGCKFLQYAKMFPTHAPDRTENRRGYRLIEHSFQKRLT